MKLRAHKVLSLLLSITFLLSLLPASIVLAWEPAQTVQIVKDMDSPVTFLFPSGNPMVTGFYRLGAGGNNEIAYCVDRESPGPSDVQYDLNDAGITNQSYLAGVQAIIQHGFPYSMNGLSDANEARYATQVAIHWLENYFLGGTEGWEISLISGTQANGYTAALAVAKDLYAVGQGGATNVLVPFLSISSISDEWTNVNGVPEAYVDVFEEDCDRWNVSSLPAGCSIVGGNGDRHGSQTLTIQMTDPAAYSAAPSRTIQLMSYTNKDASNLHVFTTNYGTQTMIALSGNVNSDPASDNLPEGYGELQIFKVTRTMDRGDVPEANATFVLYPTTYASFDAAVAAGAPTGTVTTDATGFGTSTALPLGQYILHQTVAPAGTLPIADQTVTVKVYGANDPPESYFNEQGDGYIDISKRTEKNGVLVAEPGAQFEIRNSSAALVDTLVTDNAGHARSKLLPYDTYTVLQTVAPAHTVINTTPLIFVVGANAAGQVLHADIDYGSLTNQEFKGTLSIHKTTNYSTPVPEANAGFQIYPSAYASYGDAVNAGAPTAMITTDASGNAQTGSLSYGTYVVHQYSAPSGSIRVADRTVTIGDLNGADTHIDLVNEVHTCSLSIEKQGETLITAAKVDAKDASGNPVTDGDGNALSVYDFYYESRPMDGATFSVYVGDEDIIGVNGVTLYHANDFVGSITTAPVTDSTGTKYIASMDGLPLGADGSAQYIVTETIAPLGQTLSTIPVVFDFTLEDQTLVSVSQSRVIQNTKQDVQIAAAKQKDSATWNATTKAFEYPIINAQGVVFGLYTTNDILSPNGTVIVKKDSLVDLLITGTDGKATSTKDLPFGEYYAKELKVTEELVWDKTTTFPVTVRPSADGSTQLVKVALNDGQPILNRTIKGKLDIYKLASDTDLPMSGVVFEVFDQKGTIVDTITTDANGKASTKVLPYGSYYINEVATNHGYILGGTTDFTIYRQPLPGELYSDTDLTLYNDKMATIQVFKTTKDESVPMDGVVFGIYDAATGKEISRLTTDKDGNGSVYVTPGNYYLQEIETWPGYATAPDKFEVKNASSASIYHLSINNQPTTIIPKKTSPSGEPLAGCEFKITDLDGNVIKMYWDENKAGYIALDSPKFKAPEGATVVERAVSGKDGTLLILGLIAGKQYIITETKAPTGYNNDSTPQTITVPKTSDVLGTLRFVDTSITVKTGETEDLRMLVAKVASVAVLVLSIAGLVIVRRAKRKTEE